MIIDSDYQPSHVIVQNPERPAPEQIFHSLGLMNVQYYGFDEHVHQGQIVMATKVIGEADAFFRQAFEMKFPIERVVPVSAPQYRWNGPKVLRDNVTSGFDYRPVKGTQKLSFHSRGLAFDVNPRQNPYIVYDEQKPQVFPDDATWSPNQAGSLHADHPLVKLMEGLGWEWGGHWTSDTGRTDYMHFQKPV